MAQQLTAQGLGGSDGPVLVLQQMRERYVKKDVS